MSLTSTLPRAGAVVGGATVAAATVVVVVAPVLVDARHTLGGPGPTRPDDALVTVCAGVTLLATAWLWVATDAVALAAVRGRPDRVRGVPAPVRRAVLAGCGVALATGLVAPAVATPGSPHEAHGPVAGLPYPDRALGPAVHRTDSAVRVRAGDSLWAIAARDLGRAAPDAEVAAHWPVIYRLNRAEIGPDPDLIRPAQRLRLPHA